MDVCEEDFHVTDPLRAYRPSRQRYRPQAPSPPVFEESDSTRGLDSAIPAASVAMEDDGEADVGEIDEQEGCLGGATSADSIKSFKHGVKASKQNARKTTMCSDMLMESNEFDQHGMSLPDGFPASKSAQSHEYKHNSRSQKAKKQRVSAPAHHSSGTSAAMPLSRMPCYLPPTQQQPEQPRNYRVVQSKNESLKLTLRAASPKEETSVPTSAHISDVSDPEVARLMCYHQQYISQELMVPSNNLLPTPLNIITGEESPSTSSSVSQSSASGSDDFCHQNRQRKPRHRVSDSWSSTQQSLPFKDAVKREYLAGDSNINNNNINSGNESNSTTAGTINNIGPDNIPVNVVNNAKITTTNSSSKNSREAGVRSGTKVSSSSKKPSRALAQRKGRAASNAASMKTPAPPRRANGKRSLANGPTLNGYGLPASIETMTSLKDFINYDTFNSLPIDMKRELASLLPITDVIINEPGIVVICESALRNEYFNKGIDEYLNKGYRKAAMKSTRYPLSTGHNTRQRRRNEDQGIDLDPKDEWKKIYFEEYWGEKLFGPNFDKSLTDTSSNTGGGNAPPNSEVCNSMQIKQPVVKLTRAESMGVTNDESLLKVETKEENDMDADSTPPVTPESGLPVMVDNAMAITQTPNSRANAMVALNSGSGTAKSRSGKWPRLRKRDQRNNSESASAAASLMSPDGASGGSGGARKRRRRSVMSPQLPLHRDTQLCASLTTAAASALSLVDEQAKASSAKTGSSSGPSNNSSSSPSTYGETSPQNEELGGHPSEFIKPRPPPPPTNGVAAVAAAAAANMSLPVSLREKHFSGGSSHHGVSSGAESRVSRLNGKTVGEMRRDISYRMMTTTNQRVNMTLTSTPASFVASAGAVAGGAIPSAPVLPPSLALTPVHAKGAVPGPQHPSVGAAHSTAHQLPPPPPTAAQRPRRKYALAARTFERQLQQRRDEEEKDESTLRRSKKSHEIRLKRLRERNSRRVNDVCRPCDAAKTDDSVPPFSCPSTSSQADPCQFASSDWTSTAPATASSDAKDITCASSSTTVPTPSSIASTPQRPSNGVVRTQNGASYVYRDRLCPATLGNVCKRLPDADVRLSFGVPEDLLPRLHDELTNLIQTVSEVSDQRPQLCWKVDKEKRVVHLSFVEGSSTADASPETEKSSDKARWMTTTTTTTIPSAPSSPSSAAPPPTESASPSSTSTAELKKTVDDLPVSDTPRPPAGHLVTSTVIPWSISSSSPHTSLSPTTSHGISTHDSDAAVLSPTTDDFMRDSREKKYFHLNRRVLLD